MQRNLTSCFKNLTRRLRYIEGRSKDGVRSELSVEKKSENRDVDVVGNKKNKKEGREEGSKKEEEKRKERERETKKEY